VLAPERRRRGHDEVTAHRAAAGADAVLGDVEVAQQLAARFDELFAQRGQGQPTGGAVHQAHAEALFERVQAPPHHDGRDALGQGGAGETAFFGDQYKTAEFGIAVHAFFRIQYLKYRQSR